MTKYLSIGNSHLVFNLSNIGEIDEPVNLHVLTQVQISFILMSYTKVSTMMFAVGFITPYIRILQVLYL